MGNVTPQHEFALFGYSLNKNALCGINEYGRGTYTTEGIVALMDGIKKGIDQLDEEQQKDFLIRNVAPWYVKFYASWWMAEQRGQLDSIHWVRFDDFREDCASVVEGVLEHVGLELDRANIDASIQEAMALREKLRFNKGVSGRGQEFFSERQLEDLKALTATYSQMDFEARGLL